MNALRVLVTLCILFSSSHVYAYDASPGSFALTIDITKDCDQQLIQLSSIFNPTCTFVRTTFILDAAISSQECANITGLHASTSCTYKEFVAGIERLRYKQKFSLCNITMQKQDDGWQLTLEAQAYWSVRNVRCKGNFLYKDRYRRHYFLEPGNAFDSAHHERGLQQLKAALHDDGYFACTIADKVIYHDVTKDIDAVLTLSPGKRYKFGNINVICSDCSATTPTIASSFVVSAQKVANSMLAGNFFSQDVLEEYRDAVRLLARSCGYASVSVIVTPELDHTKTKAHITIDLVLTQAARIVFSGNTFFTAEKLLSSVILPSPNAPKLPSSVVANEIQEMYHNVGFLDAVVTWQEYDGVCYYTITEGIRYTISRVRIEGSIHYDVTQLVSTYLSEIIARSYYDAHIVESSCEALLRWYLQQGFWDARLVRVECIATECASARELVVHIKEGEQRKLIGVKVVGFDENVVRELTRPYEHLVSPIPFDIRIINEQQQRLTRFVHARGYLYSTFKPEFITSDTGITLVWRLIGQETPVTFGNTVVAGSSTMSPEILLRELSYAKGEVWSPDALARSVERIKSLGIFESVSLQPANIFTPETEKTMVLRAVEDDPFEARMRIGAAFLSKNYEIRGGGTSYRVGGSFVWKNPTASGDRLQFDADWTRFTREVSCSYTRPRFFGLPITTTLKAYMSRYDQPFMIGYADILYDAWRTGFSLNYAGKHRFLEWGMVTGFELMKIEGLSRDRARVLEFEPNLADRTVPYAILEPSIFFDYLDNKVKPTRGVYGIFSVRGMFPFALRNAWYIKILAEQSCFVPLTSRVVFAARLRCGHIFHSEFDRIMPQERFYLGGSHSLRGYQPDHAPPLNVYVDSHSKEHLVPIGGKSMLNVNFETRFDIYNSLGTVLFTDMGVLSQNHFADITFKSILGSSGIGVRYNTSFGALRFDIGWKWKKRFPEDSPVAWFLTLGESF